MESRVIEYQVGRAFKVDVRLDSETVWLSQEQMCTLFGRERSVISKHIRNVFREGELDEKVSCAKFAHDTPHGAIKDKTKISYTTLYNLDVIIREMLLSRCDEIRRLDKLEHRVGDMEREMSQVKNGMNYLVKQITTPPRPPKRRPIGFNA